MIIGGRAFDTDNKCYVMGILNVTPDSFSDGGMWRTVDLAVRHAESMAADGADIIDIGGESTRPGHERISEQEEIDRAVPVVEAVHGRFDVPISIDTYKSAVAEAALSAGAAMVNDVRGLKGDAAMAPLLAGCGAACCLMHNRTDMDYADFIRDMMGDLAESVRIAREAGVGADRIVLDPGIGFAKTYEMDLVAMKRLDMIAGLGYPVMLGASRKRVVGTALGLPVHERLEGTLATTVIAVMSGCAFVRVHDVKESKRAIAMTEAVLRSNNSPTEKLYDLHRGVYAKERGKRDG